MHSPAAAAAQLLTRRRRAAAIRRGRPQFCSSGLCSSSGGGGGGSKVCDHRWFPGAPLAVEQNHYHFHMTKGEKRFLSATFTTTTGSKDSPTAAKQSVWERTARKVQDTDRDRHNVYMEAIRATHDPA
jgi:hypothetical protein